TISTFGLSTTSVILYLPSTSSSFPDDSHRNETKSSLEFSAIARNVVIKQLLTAAVYKCSGDHVPGMPLGNSGGVATSRQPLTNFGSFNSGEQITPFRSAFQMTVTLY